MGLFTPIYMNPSLEGKELEKALEALEKLKGKALINAAENAPSEKVRAAADRRYQVVLVDLIGSNIPLPEKWAAWEKLTDPTLAESIFVELAFLDHDPPDTVVTQINRVRDQERLYQIVIKAPAEKMRMAAMNALMDEALIKNALFTSSDRSVKSRALSRLSDPSDPMDRRAAAESSEDPSNLCRMTAENRPSVGYSGEKHIHKPTAADRPPVRYAGEKHTHQWIEVPGTRVYQIDRNDYSCGTYRVRCSICGAVETREFSHHWEDA